MIGVLNVNKPAGMTSHDVVARVRRLAGERRVGHAGTLDPGATGVLPLCLGPATRLAEYIGQTGKAYRAAVTFGIATDTLDAGGRETARAPAPGLGADAVAAVLPRFRGEIDQVSPMVSARKVGGRRLYELARQGVEVARAPRRVTVYRLELVGYEPGEFPVAHLVVECSSGFYVRALAADVGAALGVPAHLSGLVRHRVGPFSLEEAVTLEALEASGVEPYLLPPLRAVAHLPVVRLARDEVRAVRQGRPPRRPVAVEPPAWSGAGAREAARDRVALVGPDGQLVAVARREGSGGALVLEKVLP